MLKSQQGENSKKVFPDYYSIEDILVLKSGDSSYFFDPEALIVFSKETQVSDEEVVKDYKKQKETFPKNNRLISPKSFEDFSSVSLELHVTNDCNLRCKYCYVGDECHKDMKKQMSEDVIEKAFRFALKTYPQSKNVNIPLYGGEPLLFWKKFGFIVKKAREVFEGKEISLSFPTNGTIVNDEILSFLKDNDIGFQISMDGPEAFQNMLRPNMNGKGSFDAIKKNIPKFKKIRDSLSVRSTITPYNKNLSELVEFFKEIGFKNISFCLCSSENETLTIKEEELPELLQEWSKLAEIYFEGLIDAEKMIQIYPFQRFLEALHFGNKKNAFCGSGKNLIAVSPEGDLYSCHRFIGNEKYKVGDVDKGIDSSRVEKFFYFNVENEKKCETCFSKYICGGGCTFERALPSLEIFCQLNRHLLALCIWIYAELSTKHPKTFAKLSKKFEDFKNERSKENALIVK